MNKESHYQYKDDTGQPSIHIKNTNASIINLQQATYTLNDLYDKLMYMESCQGELACTIFQWIQKNTLLDNKELLSELTTLVSDKISDNAKYWPDYQMKNQILDHKLDFILDKLFSLLCYSDVHYEEELLGYDMGLAEKLGFTVEFCKKYDYEIEDYNFARSEKSDNLKRFLGEK